MECGPKHCPVVAWPTLSPSEQKAKRKEKAEQLYSRKFTLEQIAAMLGVVKSTISKDLEGIVSNGNNSKPAKTTSNPHGAGRPKGRKSKPRQTASVEDKIVAMSDAGVSSEEIAAQLGIQGRAVRHSIEREQARREGENSPTVDRSALSQTAQQKFDTAVRQYKRKLDADFETRCREDCRRWLNEIGLPLYAKELGELERSISSRKGIMDRLTYRKILACLHPDRVADPVLKKRYEEAFRLFTELEKRVLDEKESPTVFRKMPRTYEELMAVRAKVQAERKAKRAHKQMAVR